MLISVRGFRLVICLLPELGVGILSEANSARHLNGIARMWC